MAVIVGDGGGGGLVVPSTSNPALQQAFKPSGYSNPPPDPRLNSILVRGMNAGLPRLEQGLMQQTKDWYANTGSTSASAAEQMVAQPYPYRLNFMYNPSDITVAYALDPSITMPSQLTPDQLAASAITPGQTQISFALLFDRTYECWDGGAVTPAIPSGIDFRNVGVYADIGFFERMVGVVTTQGRSNMIPVPIVVLFGGGSGGADALQPNIGLGFVGYVTSATVDYTHFTSRMVPVRAAMQITMQELIGVQVGQAVAGGANYQFADTSPVAGAGTSTSTTGSGTGTS